MARYGDDYDEDPQQLRTSPYRRSTEAPAPPVADPGSQPSTSGPTTPPSSPSGPAGIDPRLAALYQQHGMTPGGSGTGFADWQYWQNKAGTAGWDYILGRLGADLAGTGTDQPTGTPGQGPWSRSGASGVASAGQGAGGMGAGFPGGFSVPMQSGALSRFGPQSSQLMDFLMKRGMGQMSDSSLPSLQVSATDPIIKNQVDAYRAEQERGVRSSLSRAAEGSREGAIPGAQEATARSLGEKAGTATAGYEATLMNQELNARRQELQNALSGAMGFMTAQQQMALQDELRRIELALQESQFGRNLAQRGLEFGANLDLQYAGL